MALVLVLAMLGGLTLALSELVALPVVVVALALLAWTAALALVIGMAAGRARRERRSFRSALWLVLRDVGRFIWHLSP